MRRFLTLSAILSACLAPAHADDATTPLWGRWEHAFNADKSATPDTELTVEVTSPTGKTRTLPGFWDGETTWRVRFMPGEDGEWKYRARSKPSAAGLDGVEGTFQCRRVPEDRDPLRQHGPVRVSDDRHHLVHHDGTPFFWLGDTVWNGPSLSEAKDWDRFLDDRAAKRFSVIQFNTLAPWRAATADADGQVAFTGTKDVQINPRYFQRLDARMDAINAHGLVAAPVLIWANHRDDPGNALPEADIIKLVKYQVARYGAHHVVWVLAGDNGYGREAAERWKRVGRAVFGDGPHAPVTTHPTGMNWPWDDWAEEKWLDVLGYQSGHGDDANTLRWIFAGPPTRNMSKEPTRPIINLEPPYEDHVAYQSRQRHTPHNVRRAVYWSLLNAPTAGVTYGAHGVWGWETQPGREPLNHKGTGIAKVWHEAMNMPGSVQMKHMAELFTSLPWWKLRPADDLLAAQPGDDPSRHVSAARAEDGSVALVYLPVGGPIALKTEAPTLKAEWFNPRDGHRQPARADSGGGFQAPDDQDWVLILKSS